MATGDRLKRCDGDTARHLDQPRGYWRRAPKIGSSDDGLPRRGDSGGKCQRLGTCAAIVNGAPPQFDFTSSEEDDNDGLYLKGIFIQKGLKKSPLGSVIADCTFAHGGDDAIDVNGGAAV